MKNQLKEQLRQYIAENYPEMVHQFNPDVPFTTYLSDQIKLIEPLMDELMAQGHTSDEIQNLCFKELIKDFYPSKYRYLLEIIEAEFPSEYDTFSNLGILKFTVMNIMTQCEAAFEAFDFSEETLDDRFMRYQMIAEIQIYFIDQQQN